MHARSWPRDQTPLVLLEDLHIFVCNQAADVITIDRKVRRRPDSKNNWAVWRDYQLRISAASRRRWVKMIEAVMITNSYYEFDIHSA